MKEEFVLFSSILKDVELRDFIFSREKKKFSSFLVSIFT